jgi:hypothetical protein
MQVRCWRCWRGWRGSLKFEYCTMRRDEKKDYPLVCKKQKAWYSIQYASGSRLARLARLARFIDN